MGKSITDLLELPSRRSIYEEIVRTPGLNKTTLCERTGLAWGTVDYQLHALERGGLVDGERGIGELNYYSADLKDSNRKVYAVLQKLGARRLVERLAAREAARLHELSSDLGESRKVVRRHLGRLEDAGIVEGEGLHHRQYRVTKKAIQLLHGGSEESPSAPQGHHEPEHAQYQ